MKIIFSFKCFLSAIRQNSKCNLGFCRKSYGSNDGTESQPWFWFPITVVGFIYTFWYSLTSILFRPGILPTLYYWHTTFFSLPASLKKIDFFYREKKNGYILSSPAIILPIQADWLLFHFLLSKRLLSCNSRKCLH